MHSKILTKKQRAVLDLIAKDKNITSKFYLSGGTALCEYYIPYRLSDDLDFFSVEEVNVEEILVFFKSMKKIISYDTIEYNTSYNRNLFFLNYSNYQLKLEFTYYPFLQIEKPKNRGGILVDSIMDIAVNKLFTIYQKPRTRDYIDLYMIIQQKNYKLADIIKNARIKFDTVIDPIKLGSQFMRATEVSDYPKLLSKIKDKDWQNYFLAEAKKLSKDIFN